MKRCSLALVASLFVGAVVGAPLEARAALVNDYYSTDDVWNPPIAPGHVLLDGRIGYSLAGSAASLLSPTASLVYGLAPGWEVGLWGAYSLSWAGASGVSSPQVLNPYVKTQLPWRLGSTVFGLVAGAQIPTAPNQDHDLAIEGVASIQLNSAWLLDLGLGTGWNLARGEWLGHGNAALYDTLPSGQTLFGEVFGLAAASQGASYGEHLGVSFPLSASLASDVDLLASQGPDGRLLALTPELGATWTF